VHFECPFTPADVQRADQVAVTPSIYANATFEGISALRVFSEAYLRPLLQGLLTTTVRETAVLGLYYRLAAYLASVRKLDGTIHFQSIAAGSRSVFELALDLALLASDSTTDSVDRIIAFTRVERYRVAKRLVDFYDAHALPADLNLTTQRQICADPGEAAQVEALILQYWGRMRNGSPNLPKHWSRLPDARTRARQVGQAWEERYVRHYNLLSWHVHSGLVGVTGLTQDLFDVFVADAHRLARDSALDAYSIVGNELHLAQAIEQWHEKFEFLRNVSGFTLVDFRLHALGQSLRFGYLEEHERNVV